MRSDSEDFSRREGSFGEAGGNLPELRDSPLVCPDSPHLSGHGLLLPVTARRHQSRAQPSRGTLAPLAPQALRLSSRDQPAQTSARLAIVRTPGLPETRAGRPRLVIPCSRQSRPPTPARASSPRYRSCGGLNAAAILSALRVREAPFHDVSEGQSPSNAPTSRTTNGSRGR